MTILTEQPGTWCSGACARRCPAQTQQTELADPTVRPGIDPDRSAGETSRRPSAAPDPSPGNRTHRGQHRATAISA